ncbi:hypothetical protein AZA_90434 [Nitrospirillum viridazoti Y2]|nr:hypothetical protein AZA_90434 [Nitrospirillum amazonense Y2]
MGDGDPGQRRIAQQGHVLGDQAGLMRHGAQDAVGAIEAPDVVATRARHVGGGQGRQLLRCGGPAVAIQKGGAGHQGRAMAFQHLDDQVAVLQRRHAHADGQVVAFLDDVDAAVAGLQPDGHTGMLRHVAGDDRPHAGGHQGGGAADAHGALRLRPGAVHHLLCRLSLGDHGQAVGVVGAAHVGDGEAAGGTLQQPHTQLVLQHRDAAAKGGLGHAQCPLRRGEAAMLHHLGEVVEVVQVAHGGAPIAARLPGAAIVPIMEHRV